MFGLLLLIAVIYSLGGGVIWLLEFSEEDFYTVNFFRLFFVSLFFGPIAIGFYFVLLIINIFEVIRWSDGGDWIVENIRKFVER